MKANRQIAAWAALLIGLTTMAACSGGHESADGTEIASSIAAALATAQRVEVIDQVELHGTVRAERNATVSSRVVAMVTAVRVQTGDRVRHGQLLLEIDPQTARGQVAQAQGALGQARAAMALAERNHERFEALAAVDAASELELDQARMQHETARAAVEQAEGAVAAASSVAAESSVVAPFDGWVVRRMVEVGDMAAPGRPLLTIESSGRRRLAVAVPESLMMRSGIGIGSVLDVEVDSRTSLGRLEGVVVEMAPGADAASHSSEIEIELPVADLRSGASGRTWIPAGSRLAVSVPADAVLRRGGVAMVVVREADGRSSSRVVTIGRRVEPDGVEVLSGLDGGEIVAVGLTEAPPAGSLIEERAERNR